MRILSGFVGCLLLCPALAAGQVAVLGNDTAAVIAEPGDVLGAAHSLQSGFERAR